MNNKVFTKITGVTTALLICALAVSPVFADYTAVSGTADTQFTKTIELADTATVPNVTYSYAVTSGTAINGNGTKMNVFAGGDGIHSTGTPTIADISFTASDSHSDGKVAKNTEIDFTGVNFMSPGIHRYVITESGEAASVTEATDRIFACDVYVMDNNGNLEVEAYILHSNETAEATEDDKIVGLTATFESNSLTVNKIVSGNQGVRDEYFPFDITFSNAVPGTLLSVDLSGADPTTAVTPFNSSTHTNDPTITVGDDGTVTAKYWLKNGQAITIHGIADNVRYSITESENDGDTGYTTSIETTGDTEGVTKDLPTKTTSDTAITENTTVVYTNTKGGVVPTGLFFTIGGVAAITVIGALGIIIMIRLKGRHI